MSLQDVFYNGTSRRGIEKIEAGEKMARTKTTTKKTTKAKMTKAKAGKLLGNVPEEKAFWICSGHLLKNMSELENSFMEMNNDVFYYHVNENKNDFCTWVREVIEDDKLARDLEISRTPTQAAQCVNERISELMSV